MARLLALPSVEFCVVDEATIYLLSTLQKYVAALQFLDEVVITSGTDGAHSGPDDPHHHGHALDIRTHNFPTRADRFAFAAALEARLGKYFFAFVEDPDTDNEHVHVQVRKGCVYPPPAIAVGSQGAKG